MPKFICNTDIDWNLFIDELSKLESLPNFLYDVDCTLDDNLKDEFNDELYLESDPKDFNKKMLNAKYNWNTIKWTDYNLEDEPIAELMSNLLSVKMLRCFVSKVDPGHIVAVHWDEGDVRFRSEADHDKMIRYVCFIKDMKPGQTFVVGDTCFYNEKQGAVYSWDKYTDFHSTANASTEPHYMFHLLGEKQ